GVLGFPDVRAFAGQPEDEVSAAQRVADVDTALGAFDGVAALGGVVRSEGPVDRLGVLPQTGGNDLAKQPFPFEHLADLRRPALGRLRIEVSLDDVVVVKLDAVETNLLVFADLAGERDLFADWRAERVAADADVPGTEGEFVRGLGCKAGHG